MVLGARSNPVKEMGAIARPAQAHSLTAIPIDPAEAAIGSSADAPGAGPKTSDAAEARGGPAAADSAKVRRVEDLPASSPIAYRPLRVEELPEAPGSGKRGRRGKDASSAKEAPSGTDAKATAAAAGSASRALRVEDLPSVSAAVRPLRPEELNPELVQLADDLLWNHPSPVGVDVPLEVKGKSYVARFAYHYHEFGGTKKPWGYHKGVTLYSTKE
jgi:hypothetical protein